MTLLSQMSDMSPWTRGLRRGSVTARLLRLWVRIPPKTWIFVCCEGCVLSRGGLCGPYRVLLSVVCRGDAAPQEIYIYIYIYSGQNYAFVINYKCKKVTSLQNMYNFSNNDTFFLKLHQPTERYLLQSVRVRVNLLTRSLFPAVYCIHYFKMHTVQVLLNLNRRHPVVFNIFKYIFSVLIYYYYYYYYYYYLLPSTGIYNYMPEKDHISSV